MLYAFGFEHIGVVVGDLYFRDPTPGPGQEGAERGVRLEVRVLERAPLRGSIYSAQPIAVDRPIWRADLLESVAGPVGSFDRTHHHPAFSGWEPGRRNYVKELSADPLGWLSNRLSDLPALLAEADATDVDAGDAEALRDAVPEIVDVVKRLLDRVHAGELGQAPPADARDSIRAGWL
jgi:hypothetical protein